MKAPVPSQPSPSQQNLAATVTLGLLTLVFLLIPVLAGRNRGPAFPERQPTVADSLSANNTTFVGPTVPLNERPWPADVEPAWAPSSQFVTQLQKVSLMLVLMGVVIFVTLKATNRFFPNLLNPTRGRSHTPLMEVLERQLVAPGVNLALVRVGDKTLVLGFTESSVSTVCELSAEEWQGLQERQQAESEAEAADAAAVRPDPGQVYRGIFRQYLSIIPGMGTKR